ncbi:hypothetical protein RJI07_08370 [Mycoplasmatota bacterium WC30]
MKIAVKICRIVIYILGIFFILMSFDVFDMNQYTFWVRIFGFFMNSLPGITLILLNYLLRKKDAIFGIVSLVSAVFFFFFFRLHKDILEKIIVIIIVDAPLLITSGVLLVARNKYDKVK